MSDRRLYPFVYRNLTSILVRMILRVSHVATLLLTSALLTACHRAQPAPDAIQVAARDGDIATVTALLKAHPDLISRRNGSGETALIYASCFDHKNVAEMLLAKGADVNAKRNDGFTSLHWAAAHGSVGMMQLLLSKGADVHARDNDGVTPLGIARRR